MKALDYLEMFPYVQRMMAYITMHLEVVMGELQPNLGTQATYTIIKNQTGRKKSSAFTLSIS